MVEKVLDKQNKDDVRELIPEEFIDEPEELVIRDKKESEAKRKDAVKGNSIKDSSSKENVKDGVKAEKLIEELAKQKEEGAKILEQQKEILNRKKWELKS